MHLRILPKDQMPRFVGALMLDYRVVAPVAKGPQSPAPEPGITSGLAGQFGFEPIDDPLDMRLDYNITILPPKTALQPPRERVVRSSSGDQPVVEPTVDAVPTVLFGFIPAISMRCRCWIAAFSADYSTRTTSNAARRR